MDRLRIPQMFVLLILLWSKAFACTDDELEMVQIISKHGSFAPPFVYPEDPNPASSWTEGLNDLTMLGKFQAYVVGDFLKKFYSDFITTAPTEVEVISSGNKGVVKSAQSLVTALYSPNASWEVVQNFSWQPIYIQYDNDEGQFLSDRICPSANSEYKRLVLQETEAHLPTYQNLMFHWGKESGMSLKNIVDVEELFHVLSTELTHKLTIPEWSQTDWNEMKYLHDVSVSLRTKTEKLIRLQGGPLLDRTIKSMREKSLNDKDPRKVVVYSSQTTPMQGLLATMNLELFQPLPPLATLIMELYNTEGEHFVRFLFMNSTSAPIELQNLYLLKMPGCSEFCPLDYVIAYTKDIIPKNWEQECLLM